VKTAWACKPNARFTASTQVYGRHGNTRAVGGLTYVSIKKCPCPTSHVRRASSSCSVQTSICVTLDKGLYITQSPRLVLPSCAGHSSRTKQWQNPGRSTRNHARSVWPLKTTIARCLCIWGALAVVFIIGTHDAFRYQNSRQSVQSFIP